MSKTSRRSCELCGESDGKVEKVVVQVDGRKLVGLRLCLMCRAQLVNRLFERERLR